MEVFASEKFLSDSASFISLHCDIYKNRVKLATAFLK